MTSRDEVTVPLSLRIMRIFLAVSATAGAIVAVGAAAAKRTPAATHPPAVRRAVAGDPIAAEADVFRTRPGDLAVDTGAARRPQAHPRTLAIFRALRAYPGAPPRIPHGLTSTEYRTTGCKACHERGGYSLRFGAYVPVTPHPELSDCLSCHLPDAGVVGVELPSDGAQGQCRQCHAPAMRVAAVAPLDWNAASWPVARRSMPDGTPPAIPHGTELRGNCNACHMGPAAVAEIRTDHPQRGDCRQCHVQDSEDAPAFARPGGTP